MDKIEWKAEYNVGIPLIDKQHKQLVNVINRLGDQGSGGMMSYVMDELDAYVKEHFRAEEDLMRKADYPDFAAHKDEHRGFEEWLAAVRQSFNIGGASSHMLASSVNDFLRGWLVNHILKSDMAYLPYLKD